MYFIFKKFSHGKLPRVTTFEENSYQFSRSRSNKIQSSIDNIDNINNINNININDPKKSEQAISTILSKPTINNLQDNNPLQTTHVIINDINQNANNIITNEIEGGIELAISEEGANKSLKISDNISSQDFDDEIIVYDNDRMEKLVNEYATTKDFTTTNKAVQKLKQSNHEMDMND